MDWSLLLPSTWNPQSVISNLTSPESQLSTQALSDLFIFLIITIAVFFLVIAAKQAIASRKQAGRYLALLQKNGDVEESLNSSTLPLCREMTSCILKEPSRDGYDRFLSCRAVDAAEIFRDSTLAPAFTRSRWFHSLPGVLTGLGVLGTFIGLQMGIGGLDLKNLTKLETNIVPLIEGCAVAFSTSVWGVGISLLFSGFEKFFGWTALNRIRELQTRVNDTIPRYVPEKAMSELERSSRSTEDILKGLAVAIGDEMQKAIGRLGNEIKDAMVNVTQESHGSLMKQSSELLTKALATEIVNLKEQIGSMSSQFSEQFQGVSTDLTATVKSLEPTVKTLSSVVHGSQTAVTEAVAKLEAHETVMASMTTAASEIHQAAQAFEVTKDTMEHSASLNEKAAQAQHAAATANTQVAVRFDAAIEHLPDIQQTIEDAAQIIASITGPMKDLQEILATQPEKQKEIEDKRTTSENKRNEALLRMSGELAEKVGNAAEQFTKVGSLAEKLEKAAANFQNASKGLEAYGTHVLDASKAQQDASIAAREAARHGERTAKAMEALPSTITGVAVNLENARSSLENAGKSLEKGAAVASSSYRDAGEVQKRWFEGIQLGLTATRDRLQDIINAYGNQIDGQTRNLMNQWTAGVTECLKSYETQVDEIQNSIEALQSALSRHRNN